MRIPALLPSMLRIMNECVRLFLDVRIAAEIPRSIEQWIRIASFLAAGLQIMSHGIESRCRDIGTTAQIPFCTKKRMRVRAGLGSPGQVMGERFESRFGRARMFLKVP